MLKYKYEVQNVCSKCNYKSDKFKLYEEVTEVDDFGTTKTEYEVIVCPKCEYKEKV